MTLERPASLKFDARQVLGGFGGHQGGFDNESKFEDGQDDENNR